jgi:hypothetical protein
MAILLLLMRQLKDERGAVRRLMAEPARDIVMVARLTD